MKDQKEGAVQNYREGIRYGTRIAQSDADRYLAQINADQRACHISAQEANQLRTVLETRVKRAPLPA